MEITSNQFFKRSIDEFLAELASRLLGKCKSKCPYINASDLRVDINDAEVNNSYLHLCQFAEADAGKFCDVCRRIISDATLPITR